MDVDMESEDSVNDEVIELETQIIPFQKNLSQVKQQIEFHHTNWDDWKNQTPRFEEIIDELPPMDDNSRAIVVFRPPSTIRTNWKIEPESESSEEEEVEEKSDDYEMDMD